MCLICAVTYNASGKEALARRLLQERFGEIVLESEHYPFDFTTYYEDEMGTSLRKYFVSFAELIQPEDLVDAKLCTNAMEQELATAGKRNVNLDPGYLECAKVVLATTKDYGHRIYLGRGIYGDLHLRYRHGHFEPLEWTYPDYRQPLSLEFFAKVREWYLNTRKHRSTR
ncbi:MAG: DUF4416 family protein [candidate division KSB1 bacterium]|nr:DUF4416 family protein [candidate division KSB1 bacterium]